MATKTVRRSISMTPEMRDLLAQTFELSSDEVRILNWARLH